MLTVSNPSKYLVPIAGAVVVLLLAVLPTPMQARNIKVYTFNGPSRRPAAVTPPTPTPAPAPDPEGSMTLGNLVWASVNVDAFRTFAAKPDTLTAFYQFNRKTAYSATDPLTPTWNTSNDFADSDWAAANAPCPTGWRLPTSVEFQTLRDSSATHGTWADAQSARGNAVGGRFFGVNHTSCSLPDNMTGCIFLPAVGMRYGNTTSSAPGTLANRNRQGLYWCGTQGYYQDSVLGGSLGGYFLGFSNIHDVYNPTSLYPDSKSVGHSVRCVRDL